MATDPGRFALMAEFRSPSGTVIRWNRILSRRWMAFPSSRTRCNSRSPSDADGTTSRRTDFPTRRKATTQPKQRCPSLRPSSIGPLRDVQEGEKRTSEKRLTNNSVTPRCLIGTLGMPSAGGVATNLRDFGVDDSFGSRSRHCIAKCVEL